MINLLIKLAFFKESKLSFSDEEKSAFETLINKTENGLIQYDCPYPKSRFIAYLAQTNDFIIHGSNKKDIKTFQPFKQTLFNGQLVEAVFGTKDCIWPVFFAILDRTKVNKSIRNACIRFKKYICYFFSLSEAYRSINPWTEGMLYFLPSETFESPKKGALRFDEWISYKTVEPVYQLPVSQNDFSFLDRVTYHNPKEPVFKSWFLYKSRIKKEIRYSSKL
ncbi:MAG: hypothetical protein JXL85_09185 [Bacilli bacterium]|nr:hypothetical protein [Bacilli bacterium]